jgi:hypothetical protein
MKSYYQIGMENSLANIETGEGKFLTIPELKARLASKRARGKFSTEFQNYQMS